MIWIMTVMTVMTMMMMMIMTMMNDDDHDLVTEDLLLRTPRITSPFNATPTNPTLLSTFL